jgi:hypothetical protein
MKKQTAIEWLVKILQLDSIEKLDFYALTCIERAKQMEREQITDAFTASSMTFKTADEYYLNLYKNESKTNI